MKLLLNLTGVLNFLIGMGALFSFELDNLGIAVFCLGWSVLCFYFGSKHD